MSFFLVEIKFSTNDNSWSQSYLTNSSSRLTALLKDDLDNQFWEIYSSVLINYHESNQLLYRVKSVRDSAVYLTQLWQSEECFLRFKSESLQGFDLSDLLLKRGFQSETTIQTLSELEASALLTELQKYPHILQFVSQKFKNDKMVIGDPLKKGSGYLPNPWKKTLK